MAGNLTASKSLGGSAPADTLTGGSTGYDFGLSQAGVAAPQTNVFYLRQDGVSVITQLAINAQQYTGTYGGDYSSAADLTKLVAHGDAGYGLQLDLVWNDAAAFTTYTTLKTGTGATFANRVQLPTTAFAYNNAGTPQAPTGAALGTLGPTGSSLYGDISRHWMRYVTPSGETGVGKRQFDLFYSFNYTT